MEVIRAGVRIVLQIRQGRQWNISRQALRGASATMRQMGLLLHVTDLHLSADEGALLRGIQPLATLRRTLAQALAATRAGGRSPDAILVTGDIVHDDMLSDLPADTALARSLAGAPFVCGGHLDLPDWRVVLLDSSVPGADGGQLAPAQLQLLERALATATTAVLVCLHHHPVPMSSAWLDRIGLANAAEFFRLIDACPAVRGILWGHVHQPFDGRRHGVRLLATPSTCAQFLPHSEDFAVDPRPPAYRTLELTPDGTLNTNLHWVD